MGLEQISFIWEDYKRIVALGNREAAYPQLLQMLNRVCKLVTKNDAIQFPNFFARLNYLSKKEQLLPRTIFLLNRFRIHAHQVMNLQQLPSPQHWEEEKLAVVEAIGAFLNSTPPPSLFDEPAITTENITITEEERKSVEQYEESATGIIGETGIIGATGIIGETTKEEKVVYSCIRLLVEEKDEVFLYGRAENWIHSNTLKIKVAGVPHLEVFHATISILEKGHQINLIDVHIEENDVLVPDAIIFEPDYLVDISAVAECVREYGSSPLYYIWHKLKPVETSTHLLLGNAANLFLDELVNQTPSHPVRYQEVIKKVFESARFEWAMQEHLDPTFFKEVERQFNNLQYTIQYLFPKASIRIEAGILEPSFLCETLGLQGRLDFLQLNAHQQQVVLELKSGKAPFPETDGTLIAPNHRSQALLYQIIIQKVLGVPFHSLQTFILYSRYGQEGRPLRLVSPYLKAIRELLALRNQIVWQEYAVSADASGTVFKGLLQEMTPENLITTGTKNENFLQKYIVPSIQQFQQIFLQCSALEWNYIQSFYHFITREHYLSKAAESFYDSAQGISSLWRTPFQEKLESGDIFFDLRMVSYSVEGQQAMAHFSIPTNAQCSHANFRKGDLVVFYERNQSADLVTNKQVYKGSIATIGSDFIQIQLRYRQNNLTAMDADCKYAVEHDYLDVGFYSMYRGLTRFAQTTPSRKALLLGARPPAFDETLVSNRDFGIPEINLIVDRVKKMRDYFLLLGPPGTGKTSIALRSMVEALCPEKRILLLAYTNRAVDEMCEAIESIDGHPAYFRVGSELNCAPKFRIKLLDQILQSCSNRVEVRSALQAHQLVVGTVSSLGNRLDLLKLLPFDVAIIDEASQILEPALLSVLCCLGNNGEPAVGSFVLIGDHKQLPAVVLQSEEESMVQDEQLHQIKLFNRRNSLFERLYALQENQPIGSSWMMLQQQGRMHPEIAAFPASEFYHDQLKSAGLPHQTDPNLYHLTEIRRDQLKLQSPNYPFLETVLEVRAGFYASTNSFDERWKTNQAEANWIAELVKTILLVYQYAELPFSSEESLGIITPYRSQIALIREAIKNAGLVEAEGITIDTVERFQGSQRDVILYSMCVNRPFQLAQLSQPIMENGKIIDRKLNVAITRARKQFLVTGNPTILSQNPLFKKFIDALHPIVPYS